MLELHETVGREPVLKESLPGVSINIGDLPLETEPEKEPKKKQKKPAKKD